MSEAVDLTMEEFPAFCHEKGMKCTAQRMAVFSALRVRRLHPSVDEIWDLVKRTLPTVTRDSVYRILNEFSGHGLLARLDALSAARYDTRTEPHAHFVCEVCEGVTDYPLPAGFTLPEDVRGEPRHWELRVSGICENCLSTRK